MKVLILLLTVLAVPSGRCEMEEVVVAIGSDAVLPCTVLSSNAFSSAVSWRRMVKGRVEKTVWRRDKSGLEFRPVGLAAHVHCPLPNFGQGDYSLHINGVREEDAGMYHCVVEGSKRDLVRVVLRVIKVTFNPAEVTEGQKVQMTCDVTPKPLKRVAVRWRLAGATVRPAATSQTHTIYQASQSEAGNWCCLVQYEETRGEACAQLHVRGVVLPKERHVAVYGEVGSSVTLPCVFSDGLFANSVSWKKVSDRAGSPASHVPTIRSASGRGLVDGSVQRDWSAHIDSVQEDEEGTYRCSGQVEGGSNRRVTVERDIELVTARAVQVSQSDGVKFVCELSNASQVTHYEWLSSKYDGNATQTLSSVRKTELNSLTATFAEMKDLGELVCRYYEQQRLLGNITFHMQIMSSLAGEKTPVDGQKAAVVLGLGFLFLLVLLILFQMYKNHRRRRMIMQYPAMETIVHQAAIERERRDRKKSGAKGQSSAPHGGQGQEEV
ncbi:uncharacterized protein lag3 isoform X2 [Brachyhypopomus gauderio]|uniref:uncharacterized protein lag3 isoform X2 n=2 Tax=Brachyhypopomus gauderio TaxID=698409 RepID=UPI00404304C8